MGATLVLAIIRDGRLTVAHLGDSRAYRFHLGTLSRLTADHSVVELLLEQGVISGAEARDHPARGRITRYVGMDGTAEPDIVSVDFAPGDRLLLCTDGLTSVLPDAALADVLTRTDGDPAAASEGLVRAALAAGTADNVTALVAEQSRELAPRATGRRHD
jgi:protein phosphatase